MHPDLRRRFPAGQPGRIGRAYAAARWPVDWSISFMSPALVEKGHAARCGFRRAGYSVKYPASPWGDLEFAITSLSASEAYEDFTAFLEGDDLTSVLARPVAEGPASAPRRRAVSEINVSPLGPRQGSRSLS